MDHRLFESKLVNHEIFKDIKDSLKDNNDKLRNLIELKDEVLYVWNSVENCLFSLNLKHLEEHDGSTNYQKLHLVSPPSSPVERVMSSECGSRLCLWGSRVVTVVELPSRWGRGGLFDSGIQTVLCKSYSVDERFLFSQAEVRRVQWHPKSLSHLLVLVSDNTLRLYNIALKTGPKLIKMFTIGPKPSGPVGTTILESLGDTAVDFTSTPDMQSLIILTGNGDVYTMPCDLDSKSPSKPKLSGPLVMYPPADDNYGSESCSVVTLGGGDTPPLVVIATCSAQLYHCLLLPNASDKGESEAYALYVVEAVELDLLLDAHDTPQPTYPVHLYRCTRNTYACMHADGIHTVTLPILAHLKDYALVDDCEAEAAVAGVTARASVARALLRTRAPPAGLALAAPPAPALLALCAAGPRLRPLEPYDLEEQLYKDLQLKNPALDDEDINNLLKERQKLSFTTIIQEILSREMSQPILNIASTEKSSPKESLELLTQATMKLRGEYVGRQQRALDAAGRKLASLLALARHHHDWLNVELQKDIDDVLLRSAVLNEKRALAEKYQDDMKYRCSAVVRYVRARGGGATPSGGGGGATPGERALLEELERYRRCGARLTARLHSLKEHAAEKAAQLKKWEEDYKKKNIALGKSHSDTISSILQQQTSQISSLIEETKLLKDQLSIV